MPKHARGRGGVSAVHEAVTHEHSVPPSTLFLAPVLFYLLLPLCLEARPLPRTLGAACLQSVLGPGFGDALLTFPSGADAPSLEAPWDLWWHLGHPCQPVERWAVGAGSPAGLAAPRGQT